MKKIVLLVLFLIPLMSFSQIKDVGWNYSEFWEKSRFWTSETSYEDYSKIRKEYLNKPDLLDAKYKNKRGMFVIFLDNIELFLAQNEILSKLTNYEKIELAKECIAKHDEKCKNNDLFGIENIHSTVLILGRILQLEGEYHLKNNDLNTIEFIRKGKLEKIGNFNEIIENAKIYVSKQ